MVDQEKKNIYMNRNVKLFPTFLALSWDIFFVWTISTMFFTEVKNLSYSQTIVLDSILMVFVAIMCFFLPKVLKEISAVKVTRFAVLGYAGYAFFCIVGETFSHFIIAEFCLAFGYALWSVKINTVLLEPLKIVKRDKEYQRIYGKGSSLYYILESVSAMSVTYLYSINVYLPYYAAIAVAFIAFMYSFLFIEPAKFQDKNVEINNEKIVETKPVKDNNDSFKGLFKKSAVGFVVSLLLFAFFLRGLNSVTGSAFKIFMQEMIKMDKLPLWIFGYLYAGSRIACAVSSKFQFKYDLKFGVKSLIILPLALIVSYFMNGIIMLFAPLNYLTIGIVVLSSYIQMSLRPVINIFVNNYINQCVKKQNSEFVFAIRSAVECLGYSIFCLVFSGLISGFNDNIGLTNLVFVSILAIPLIVSTIVFIRVLIKRYTSRNTIIRKEYVED